MADFASIASIINVNAYAVLDNTGTFSVSSGFPINPSEVIIRSITYNPSAGAKVLLLIQSNIGIPGIIGSCVTNVAYLNDPGTRIKIFNPLPNILQFSLLTATLTPYTSGAGDQICISMDFITYKK